ncbi:MAG: helix-turn-helix domain-containing protein [Solirubrobacteraceae bacterium]
MPLELEQIEQTLTELATGGQEQSGAVAAPRCGNVPAVDREWLSVSECAGITGLSESTVRRALRDGLPSARVGRSRRIHRDSLAEFMGGRA